MDPAKLPAVLRHKWPGRSIDEGYVPVAKRLVRCAAKLFVEPHGLDELLVILAIVDHERPSQVFRPTHESLCDATGLPRENVDRSLQSLQTRKLLIVRPSEYGLEIDYAPLVEEIIRQTDD